MTIHKSFKKLHRRRPQTVARIAHEILKTSSGNSKYNLVPKSNATHHDQPTSYVSSLLLSPARWSEQLEGTVGRNPRSPASLELEGTPLTSFAREFIGKQIDKTT